MFAFRSQYKSMSGMTLIELLICLALEIFLLGLLCSMYLFNQNCHHWQSMLIKMQDNAQTTINLLTSNIKKSGYIGCARLTKDFPLISSVPTILTAMNKLVGAANEITVQFMEFPGAYLIQETAENLIISSHLNIKIGDLLLISDCKHAEIFQVKDYHVNKQTQIITPVSALKFHFDQFAEIGHLQINKFFISKTNRFDQNGKVIYGLFLQENMHDKFELVDGIENMNITYLIKEGNAIKTVSSDDIKDWSQVIGVAIKFDSVTPLIKKTWYMYVALG